MNEPDLLQPEARPGRPGDTHRQKAPLRERARGMALAQGAFYLATGIWPIVSIRTFELVTGPKADRWLVKTVGGLIGVVGGALLASARRRNGPSRDLAAVAVGSAAALAAADVIYVSKRRIPPVYLLDAAAELALIAGWSLSGVFGRRRGGRR